MEYTNQTYTIQAANLEESERFFAMSPERDAELHCIGHVRIDFGRTGTEFYHTWHPRGPETLNTAEFKEELTFVVDDLRKTVLQDLPSMRKFCRERGGAISGGWTQNYGYIIETERYSYYLRCNPVQGDYQAYLTCFENNKESKGA